MPKTYVELQKQIEALQAEAEKIKSEEVAGVIERIKEAVASYGLQPSDIFGSAVGSSRRGRKAGVASTKRKVAGETRYRDESGNVWSGRGPRPGWFKAAIEAGKNVEDYLVK